MNQLTVLARKLTDKHKDRLTKIAYDVTDEYFECSMGIGKTLQHPDGRIVKIKDGCFRDPTYDRISNWWTWNEILPGELLGADESGYGW